MTLSADWPEFDRLDDRQIRPPLPTTNIAGIGNIQESLP